MPNPTPHAQDPNADAPSTWQINPLIDLAANARVFFQSLFANKNAHPALQGGLFDEFLIYASESQINDALYRFVTKNVQMLHDLRLDLRDDWLRLYATLYTSGVYVSVAANLRLVGAQINPTVQRFIFEQIGDTEFLDFHSKKWWQVPAAKAGVKAYRFFCRADPLPFLLQKIKVKDEPFAVHKGKYIYLDIGRYFSGKTQITDYFKKAQVNYAYTQEKNLLLKLQVHFGELIHFGGSDDNIVSEKDNPDRQKTKEKT